MAEIEYRILFSLMYSLEWAFHTSRGSRFRHVAPPCCYSRPDQTNQTRHTGRLESTAIFGNQAYACMAIFTTIETQPNTQVFRNLTDAVLASFVITALWMRLCDLVARRCFHKPQGGKSKHYLVIYFLPRIKSYLQRCFCDLRRQL